MNMTNNNGFNIRQSIATPMASAHGAVRTAHTVVPLA
jgi:hypothetical protein